MSATFLQRPMRADEVRVHPESDADLQIPVEHSTDIVETLLIGFAVIATLILVVWFMKSLVGPLY